MLARIGFLLLAAGGVLAAAQPPPFSNAVRNFITVDAPVIAQINARGGPSRWASKRT